MKKFTAVCAAAALVLTLSACGKTTEPVEVPQPDIDTDAIVETVLENVPDVDVDTEPQPEDDGVMSYADYAAAALIAKEAGCSVTDIEGNPLSYTGASSALCMSRGVEEIPDCFNV